jgi:hypothetical protein
MSTSPALFISLFTILAAIEMSYNNRVRFPVASGFRICCSVINSASVVILLISTLNI